MLKKIIQMRKNSLDLLISFDSMSIMSGQTQNVILTCYIPTNVQVGTTDRITFTSHGVNYASQTAILTVVSPQATAVVSKESTSFFIRIK